MEPEIQYATTPDSASSAFYKMAEGREPEYQRSGCAGVAFEDGGEHLLKGVGDAVVRVWAVVKGGE